MSVFHNMMLAGAGGQSSGGGGSYQIARSLRFNQVDSAYLSRTPSQAGNRKTWTWAGWLKRSRVDAGYDHAIFGTSSTSPYEIYGFSGYSIRLEGSSPSFNLVTTAALPDPSAWYHIVIAADTTQTTPADRIKIYVNGAQITSFTTVTYVSQNADLQINGAVGHTIGGYGAVSRPVSGYLADIYFIDGQALTPSSFGETDANGIWQPKAYTGTYGTNGFHLDFADNSNTTAATLGKDTSGNGNNWTPNNFSVASGAGNDSLVDSPTSYGTDTGVGGEVRGNYCTLNSLNTNGLTTGNGNLEVTGGTNYTSVAGTFGISSGKWYWECAVLTGNEPTIGISDAAGIVYASWFTRTAYGYGYYTYDGTKFNNNSRTNYGASCAAGDIVGVAFDADTGALTFYKNGVSQGVAFTVASGITYYPAFGKYSATAAFNFGQRPFAYAAPSGFKCLCSANLPDESITTSGTFTGNANADGPFVYLKGVPTTMTINGNAVTFGTHADKLANGFKVRTNSTSYNTSGSNTYSVTATGDKFRLARAQANP